MNYVNQPDYMNLKSDKSKALLHAGVQTRPNPVGHCVGHTDHGSHPVLASATVVNRNVEGPLYLLRHYEQTLANWFLLGGYDVEYNKWGWGN